MNFYIHLPCDDVTVWSYAETRPRWERIKNVLHEKTFPDTDSIVATILSYNEAVTGWNFDGLREYLEELLTADERKHYSDYLLPGIAELALQLGVLVPKGIPILRKREKRAIALHQRQIGSLLANGFFCTFRIDDHRLGSINFNKLFALRDGGQKLKCLFHYFSRILAKEAHGVITFNRRVVDEFPAWASVGRRIRGMQVFKDGTIEDNGTDMLQMDFASRHIGGGVMNRGSVQEEILFLIKPELIVARLFCEEMLKNEAIIITGTERYSKYTGYGGSFQWAGDFQDETPHALWCWSPRADNNRWRRRKTTIVAVDALNYSKNPKQQYAAEYIERELNKAYAGFAPEPDQDAPFPPVATGNWGCGVYKGNKELKSIIQLMAAAMAERDLVYFTFGDGEFTERLQKVHAKLTDKKFTVAQLYQLIVAKHANRNLFDFILTK